MFEVSWSATDDPSRTVTVWVSADNIDAWIMKLNEVLGAGARVRAVWVGPRSAAGG